MNLKYLSRLLCLPCLLSSGVILFLSVSLLFSEIIMLKNGKNLQGKILSHDEEGFSLERWDTAGIVELK